MQYNTFHNQAMVLHAQFLLFSVCGAFVGNVESLDSRSHEKNTTPNCMMLRVHYQGNFHQVVGSLCGK